ncbi:MAG TPA: CocE/NonD family hydrolase [Acidimicrobiales bacterium]|nr:CocE/NonD family hydrolase [Acidimicrobiales bacterium]
MRDGIVLRADVHRPVDGGEYPVLIAASPYPRQIQDLGAPMGFIEAGATDFFVPRGYVHVIANLRGTGGSEGTFGFHDAQERLDLFDLVEWAAEQPWSNGRVGMIGISYFAMTQLEAASQHPPHLEAIFPIATSSDLYEGVYHHGLFNSTFISPFLSMVGTTSEHNDLWRGTLIAAARRVLNTPRLHKKFATMNGESSIGIMKAALRLHHDPHPWDDLWRSVAVEHQARDSWWDERNVLPLLEDVTIPVYLGCDWENVPLHLPGTFGALEALSRNSRVRVAMLGQFGLTWPWESLHVEALAWFDHWLKEKDTGILEGPPIRYWLPVADEWRTADSWPPPGYDFRELVLSADGSLGEGGPPTGSREYLTLGVGLNRARTSPADPPPFLTWTTHPLERDWDVVGNMEVLLDAQSTAIDTTWILTLQDVAADGSTVDITQGYLRASLRLVDDEASLPGAPELPCRQSEGITIGETVQYRIPLVPNARRVVAGHRLRLVLTSDDQREDAPAMMGFRHGTVGTNSINAVLASSRILLPVSEGSH